jgi:hypothetical protein
MTPKKQLVIGLGLIGGVSLFLFGRSIYRKIRVENILELMRSGLTGDISQDFSFIFSGKPYIDALKGKKIILLKDDVAKQYAKSLNDFICKTYICNTNEEGIYAEFRKMANKAQVAQVSAYFSAIYKRDLLAALLKDFDRDEQEKLFNIIVSKPDYEVAQ